MEKKNHSRFISFILGLLAAIFGTILFCVRNATHNNRELDKYIEENRERAVSNHRRAEQTAQAALNTIRDIREKQKIVDDDSVRESWDNCELFDNSMES